jgi:hypothetical protein
MTRRHVSTFDALITGAYDGLADMPVVFFSPAFLIAPNPGWRVCGKPQPKAFGDPTREPGELGQQLDDMLYAYLQSAPGVQNVNTRHDRRRYGTLVKLAQPQRVWVLTGHRDFRTGYYEGQWPD